MAQNRILVSIDQQLVGVIAISDPLKPPLIKVIAREVPIDSIIAEAKPEQKAEEVKNFQAEGYVVAMVGDGINDSPALVAADFGMAIGDETDIAIKAADIILMKSNLEDVITTINLSRKTFLRIRLNYIFAFAYNIIGIPIAVGALFPSTRFRLPHWVAGAAMAVSSVSVVCCSLLLKKYKRPKKLETLDIKGVKVE